MTEARGDAAPRRWRRVLVPGIAAVGLAVAGVAAWRGSAEPPPNPPAASAETGVDTMSRVAQLPLVVSRLAARLEQDPADAQGRVLLARSYVQMGQTAQGIAAFREAVALRPNDPSLLVELADALAFANGRRFGSESRQLLAKALGLDPSHAGALSLAGLAAFDAGDYAAASAHWRRYLEMAPDGALGAQVRQGLSEAEHRLRARRP